MRVILQEKIAHLGNVGDEVTVKAGFARNYLIPNDLALLATKENLAVFEKRRAELEKAAAEHIAAAKKRADKLNGLEVTIAAQASDEGKLFGSITPRDVADAVTAAGQELQKSEVDLPEGPIRAVGDYDIHVHLHSEVSANIKLKVIAEKSAA